MTVPRDAVQHVGFWYRLAAFFWDAVLIGVIAGVVSVPFWFLPLAHGPVVAGVAAVVALAYWTGFTAMRGATPGKWLLSSRVIDLRTGLKPTPLQALARHSLYLVSMVPAGLGFAWILWDREKRAWHDIFTRTRVVADESYLVKDRREVKAEAAAMRDDGGKQEKTRAYPAPTS